IVNGDVRDADFLRDLSVLAFPRQVEKRRLRLCARRYSQTRRSKKCDQEIAVHEATSMRREMGLRGREKTKAKPRFRRTLGLVVSSACGLFPFMAHAQKRKSRAAALLFLEKQDDQCVMVKLRVIVFVADPLVPVTVKVASVGFL